MRLSAADLQNKFSCLVASNTLGSAVLEILFEKQTVIAIE
jgi:hypothetical protein